MVKKAIRPGDKYRDCLKLIVLNQKKQSCLLITKKETAGLEEIKETLNKEYPELEIKEVSDLECKQELKLIWPQIKKELSAQFSFGRSWLARCRLIQEEDTLHIQLENGMACKNLGTPRIKKFIKNRLYFYMDRDFEIKIVNGDFSPALEENRPPGSATGNSSKKGTSPSQNHKQKKAEHKAQPDNKRGVMGAKGEKSITGNIIYGRKIKAEPSHEIEEIRSEKKSVVIRGRVFNQEVINTRNGNVLLVLSITDDRDSITAKMFLDSLSELNTEIEKNMWLKVRGSVEHDDYSDELVIKIRDISTASPRERKDQAQKTRGELHLHTKMSTMDSVADLKQVLKTAENWGHDFLALTDHGVVQSFPEAYEQAKDMDIKVIYGMEAYVVDDGEPIVLRPREQDLQDEEYVVFDLETTGLNPHRHEIIEIGAVKFKGGQIQDRLQTFVAPEEKIPEKITELTGINQDMVADAPDIGTVLPEFLDFVAEGVLTAHNLSFDLGFIEDKIRSLNLSPLTNPALDTLQLSRALVPELKSYKLNKLADFFNKKLDNHHRALDDARVTSEILQELLSRAEKKEIHRLSSLNRLMEDIDHKKMYPHHTTILARNRQGLKNLYRLVSNSHIDNFHRVPRILKSELLAKRKGLLLGSGCESGQLYQAVLQNKPEEELLELARTYDYLEVQPPGNNNFLIREGEVESEEELQEINRKIYEIGQKTGLPAAAVGDVHFLNPEDQVYRQILMEGQGFDDAADQAPLYFRTTEEMLSAFDFMDQEAARELVIENPRKIADKVEEIEIIPDKLFTPRLEGADEKIRKIAYREAEEMYGSPLPEIVENRLEKELEAIIGNGYAVIYLTSRRLVKKSLEDGYLVGSRGSVGSSLAATMTGITEVNPLPPHYRCPKCSYSNFNPSEEAGVGADLPDRNCPECETELIKDGFDIPFEVFLGFEGDKVPDIDLNFSGEYQMQAHEYTEEIFGEDRVFRAGTISKIADRTAFGFVKGYVEDNNLNLRDAEMDRLITGCTGVKRTTGQHPGGQIIVPEEREIYDFTPIQRPANDQDSNVLTTHFEFESIHDNLLKLDILGHDDPTALKRLNDLTGIDPQNIPLDDQETMSLFSGTEVLGVEPEELKAEVGTLGIPEFGTEFVRQMLAETRPTTFAELIRISGLSHGTDVWLNNARDLIKKGKAELSEVISVRDDIMNYLIDRGLEPDLAFQIMEDVRHGAGLTEEQEQEMREQAVPEWYIDSCRKIKYMFPKAHAAAYVMMAFRIAYFKVHYPREFYTVYFSLNSSDFDAQLACQKLGKVRAHKQKLNDKEDKTAKDNSVINILEIVEEAVLRGITFEKVDLYKSAPRSFQLTEKGLIPPLTSLKGLGSSAAESIVRARKKDEFSSIEDLINRTGVSKTVIEVMQEHGILDGMPESSQMSLFES